jgi:hypothetical protein
MTLWTCVLIAVLVSLGRRQTRQQTAQAESQAY